MKIIDIKQRTDEWGDFRKGKITGTKLKDIVVKRGTGKKIGFYELLADRLATSDGYEEETPMDRGVALENEALEKFAEKTGKKIEQVGFCVSDENENIALSPDGLIKNKGKYTEAVEIKCLATARHLEAHFEQKIQPEYEMQILQYFIVNDDLEKLYFVYYDPRVQALPLHHIEVNRQDIEDQIQMYKDYQVQTLKEIDELAIKLAF